jgi:hypothetical protein
MGLIVKMTLVVFLVLAFGFSAWAQEEPPSVEEAPAPPVEFPSSVPYSNQAPLEQPLKTDEDGVYYYKTEVSPREYGISLRGGNMPPLHSVIFMVRTPRSHFILTWICCLSKTRILQST